MSILAQNHTDEVALLDCIQKFFAKHHVGKLLKQCNGTKEKGVPSISLLKYKLGNIFIGRSMYMQQRTGSFKEDFSKNTFYRFFLLRQTGFVLRHSLPQTSLTMGSRILPMPLVRMYSSLMTVFSIVPVVKKLNWVLKSLTILG